MSDPASVPDQSAEALLAALRSGDDRAFERIVREQTPRLLRVARRLLPVEEDARDAVQDAFVSVVRSIDGFASNAQLSTWLHRIVVNCCLMKLRTRRRHPEEAIEPLLPRFIEDGHQETPSAPWCEPPDSRFERSQLRQLVRAGIERLPESYRVILVLRDLEELSTEEVAAAVGITPNAVKIRLHRARQALRGLLDPVLRASP